MNRFKYNNYQIASQLPLSLQDTANLADYRSECGRYKYFYENRTIAFVLNAGYNCSVRIILVNVVQVNLRLAVTVEEFYNDDTQTSFINRISAFLGISTNRIKIVGIRAAAPTSGRLLAEGAETQVVFEILSEKAVKEPEENKTYSPLEEYQAFKNITRTLEEGIKQNTLDIPYEVTDYSD